MRSPISPGPGRLFGCIADSNSSTLYWVIFGSVIVIAAVDSYEPLNVEVWLLGVVPLVLSFASAKPMLPIYTVIASTIGIVVGTVLSPPGFDLAVELINRAVGAAGLWMTAAIGYSFVQNRLILRETNEALQAANEALQAELIERTKYEEKERLLIGEINHRSKNMLMVVDAIARQTAATRPEDFVEHFSERVQALSANRQSADFCSWPDSANLGDAANRRLSGVHRTCRQRHREGSP